MILVIKLSNPCLGLLNLVTGLPSYGPTLCFKELVLRDTECLQLPWTVVQEQAQGVGLAGISGEQACLTQHFVTAGIPLLDDTGN